MLSEYIINISQNFNQQVQFYTQMLDLSVRQLQILEEGGGVVKTEEINLLLLERQRLMEIISRLNKQNKDLQSIISAELNMDEFVLTSLESEIDEAQYQDLKMLVAKLGETLRAISDNDEKSQLLMKQGLRPVVRQNPRVENEHASNAYKQAMKQTAPKPDK